ncbi:MAG: alpha/beta hydrolase, partial [Verrucomicrobiales bacterium]
MTLSLRNPMLEQSVQVGGRSFPVAADFSAPLAVNLAGRNEWIWGLSGFFEADKRAKASGIALTEPYDPSRIPVILIHGLVSVPIIWRDTIPRMLVDPEISRRYQFWVFMYPSSYPVAQSALLLREELAAVRAKYDPNGNDPLSTNVVVAGHSMGGVLAHALVTDFGDNFWNEFSDVPIDEFPVPPEKREVLRKLAYFEPDPAVRRIIFYSAPHGGAEMAESGLVGLISKTAELPGEVFQAGMLATQKSEWEGLPLKVDLDEKVTSVYSLRPGAPMLAAFKKSPIRKGVIYHSVIGDRGKGDTPDSSDGVVPYWSSHLDGAASELIVPSGASSFADPAG